MKSRIEHFTFIQFKLQILSNRLIDMNTYMSLTINYQTIKLNYQITNYQNNLSIVLSTSLNPYYPIPTSHFEVYM